MALHDAERAPSAQDAYAGWEDVYTDNVGWIYRMLYAKVGNRADAEDVTTEVFLAALRPLDITASCREVRAYLKLTARTALARHWQRHYKMEITRLSDDAPGADTEETPDARAQERARAIIATLSDRYRRILELRFLEGMSVREAARTMGISVGNARVLQHRALSAAARGDG